MTERESVDSYTVVRLISLALVTTIPPGGGESECREFLETGTIRNATRETTSRTKK